MPVTTTRSEQIARFYTAQHHHLHQLVARRATTPHDVLEDACQTAWTILVRRPDITLDDHGLAWLATVAIHEAWRQANTTRHEPPAAQDPVNESDPVDHAITRELHDTRVAALLRLTNEQRRALLLQAAGYRYQDIAALTGATHRTVTRRLTEGRGRLRQAQQG